MVSESCSLSQQCCGQFLCLFRDSVWSPLLGRLQLLISGEREIVQHDRDSDKSPQFAFVYPETL